MIARVRRLDAVRRGLALAALGTGCLVAPAAGSEISELPQLLRRVVQQDGDVGVRLAAARRLAPEGDREVLEVLRQGLADAPTGLGLYEDAAWGLAASPDPGDASRLVQAIDASPSASLRAKVAPAAFHADALAARARTRQVLADPARPREARLATSAAACLADLGGAASVAALEEAYSRYGADGRAGPAVLRALTRLDPAAVSRVVLAAARGARWTARRAAAGHMLRVPRPQAASQLATLFSDDPVLAVREAAGEALIAVDPAALGRRAQQALEGGPPTSGHRAYLLDRLAALRWRPAEALVVADLHASSPLVRAAATRAAGAMGSGHAWPVLRQRLEDRDGPDENWLRTWSARAMAGLRGPEVVAVLDDALGLDPEAYVVQAAARSLAAQGDAGAWGRLRARCHHPERPEVRRAAVHALARHAPALEDLARRLREDEDAGVRAQAATSLAGPAEDGAARQAALQAAARDAAPAVRAAAFSGLARRPEWAGAARGLAEGEVLTAEHEAPVRAALRVLAKAGGAQAVHVLVRAAAEGFTRSVRQDALRYLEVLDREQARAAAERALADDPDETLRVLAARALGRLDPAASYPALKRAVLREASARVRRAAVQALAPPPVGGEVPGERGDDEPDRHHHERGTP